MFPIAKDRLSFREISNYWSREINPPASSKELSHILEAAWWLGELRGDSVHSPLQLLKKMFTSMRDRDDLGIVFVLGNSAGPFPIELPDGSVTVDLRHEIRVPSSNIESWDEISCSGAFQALAGTCSLDSYPDFAPVFNGIPLSYREFTAWLAKRGFDKPTFWRPGVHTPKKCWKAKPGKELTPHEEAVLTAINELFPNGKLDYKAKQRDASIMQFLEHSGRSKVSPRVIQRTLAKIAFG
jgi:hypothetical protein